MAVDGSVGIVFDLSVDEAEKEVARLKREILSIEESLGKKNAEKTDLEEKAEALSKDYEEAASKLNELKRLQAESNGEINYQDQIASQREIVNDLMSEMEKYDAKIEKVNEAIEKENVHLNYVKERYTEIAELSDKQRKSTIGSSDALDKLGKRIKGLIARVFVFSLITKALNKILQWFNKVLQNNKEAQAEISKLQAALLTLSQPFVEVIIPAFIEFVKILTRVTTMLAKAVSTMFGSSFARSAEKAKKLYEEIGEAAEDAAGSLAGFDEINTIQTEDKSSSGFTGDTAPDFKGMMESPVNAVLEFLMGTAIFAIGAILTFSGANIPIGLGMMVIGGMMIYDAVKEDWQAIKTELKGFFKGILALIGTALLVIGILLCFTGVAIPLGIALIALGAAAIATEVIVNWETISQKVDDALSFVKDVVMNIYLMYLGIILMCTGVLFNIGLNLFKQGYAGIKESPKWGFISEKIDSVLAFLKGLVSGYLIYLGVILLFSGVGIPLGLYLIKQGYHGLASSESPIWNTVADKIKNTWETIKQWWNTHVAKYFTEEYWKEKGREILEALKKGLTEKVSSLTSWASGVWDSISGFFTGKSTKTMSIDSGIGMAAVMTSNSMPISGMNIPRLAQGAVVPKNREFLSILGDNKNETEIVSPLSTMKQAFLEAMREAGGAGNGSPINVNLVVDGKTLAKVVVPNINDMTRAAGKPVLLY